MKHAREPTPKILWCALKEPPGGPALVGAATPSQNQCSQLLDGVGHLTCALGALAGDVRVGSAARRRTWASSMFMAGATVGRWRDGRGEQMGSRHTGHAVCKTIATCIRSLSSPLMNSATS